MNYLHYEDLELQIELAKLQAEAKRSVVACVTYLGLIGLLMVALFQSFLAIPEERAMMKYLFLAAYVALAVLFFAIGRLGVKEIEQRRKEIVELKKKYMW